MSVLTVRFSENERYDINRDCEVVVFMATTDKGSYWAETETDDLAEKRRKFKETVIDLMRNKEEPGEISFGID